MPMMGNMQEDDMMEEDSMVGKRAKKHMQDMQCDQPECGDMNMMNSEIKGMMKNDKMPMNSKKMNKSKKMK